jgi:phosphoglucomutase/phosphomannomutase
LNASETADSALPLLEQAVAAGDLSSAAADSIRTWLTDDRYVEYADEVGKHLFAGRWETLEEVFWTTIPFGTAGRRGKMYPIGCNAINDRTMGETFQAVAEYVKSKNPSGAHSCAIGYDTRHKSREFAELAAEIMLANGFRIFFLDGPRATPLLSTTIRQKKCSCGIMVTASHNPPSDNAAKVFWSTGGQLRAPHDEAVTKRLDEVGDFHRKSFATSQQMGDVKFCQDEMLVHYTSAVVDQGFPTDQGNRSLRIVFSPLHGVGTSSIVPVLKADGFRNVEIYASHAEPNGDFPNVPDNVANPENPAVFSAIIMHAMRNEADLILASDPDADRIGCAAPVEAGEMEWATLTGNQIGVVIADYVLSKRQAAGTLTPDHYLIKTLVTTDMYYRLGESFGIRVVGDCLTGFKWIGSLVDELGPEKFIMGTEEAHGYLLGTYARDKDGAVAAMLLAEIADEAKANGETLHDRLNACYAKYGCHQERTISKVMPGAEGMANMQQILENFRESPPTEIGGMQVVETRDYLRQTIVSAGESQPLDGPSSNLLIFRLEEDKGWAAVRPSGTEPKIKFYLFTAERPEDSGDIEATKDRLQQRLTDMEHDFLA